MVARNADAHVGTDAAHMGAYTHTAGADTRTRADTADMGATAHILGIRRSGREQRQGKH
jgi:hypothetical protein